MRAILYRILGNDLPPRHSPGQTLSNLQFLLEHEPAHDRLEKRWLLNRICDPAVRESLIEQLEAANQSYDEIPFSAEQFRNCWLDTGKMPEPLLPGSELFARVPRDQRWRALDYLRREKNRYLVNVNAARNHCVTLGIERGADWVLPWDGGCYLTAEAWAQIEPQLVRDERLRYVVVPLARIAKNGVLLTPDFQPEATGEPQLIFSRNAKARFDESLRYGSMNKALFLKRLGVPGPWQEWEGGLPWESLDDAPLSEAGLYSAAGYAVRLAGQQAKGRVRSDSQRWIARISGVLGYTQRMDRELIRRSLARRPLLCWQRLDRDSGATNSEAAAIRQSALRHSSRVVESVTVKPAVPRGATKNHYFSMPPYWHPDAAVPGGYRRIDGQPRSEARLYAAGSGFHDRTRWQWMVDACCALALDAHLNGSAQSGEKAREQLRVWFIDPATRMLPDGSYAQLTPGPHPTRHWIGAVDFRDTPALLDAITLLQRGEWLAGEELTLIESWMRQWLVWLVEDERALSASRNVNNPGTWYLYLVLSLSIWLGDADRVDSALDNLMLKRSRQFTPAGFQPAESARADSLHYALFNLQAWRGIANACRTLERNLWNQVDSAGRCLAQACRATLAVDRERVKSESGMAIRAAYLSGSVDCNGPEIWQEWPFEPGKNIADLGLPPFWQLSLSES